MEPRGESGRIEFWLPINEVKKDEVEGSEVGHLFSILISKIPSVAECPHLRIWDATIVKIQLKDPSHFPHQWQYPWKPEAEAGLVSSSGSYIITCILPCVSSLIHPKQGTYAHLTTGSQGRALSPVLIWISLISLFPPSLRLTPSIFSYQPLFEMSNILHPGANPEPSY